MNRPVVQIPAWPPDGKKIVFAGYRSSGLSHLQSGIFVVDADGKNPKLVYEESEEMVSVEFPTWSPDGEKSLLDIDNALLGKQLPF